jgi:glycosyltransferase involved in cell wall biosynthesis
VKLRILWLIDSLGPGGAESLMPSLVEHLDAHGVQSRVCVLQSRLGNPIAGELVKRGIAVDLIQVDNLHSINQILRLFRYIRRFHPDIIHTQLETSDILGSIISRVSGIPSVCTLHTLSAPSKKRTSRLRKKLHNLCLRLFCDKIIAVSDVTRQHFIKLGISSNKLITLYNGIDLTRFNNTGILPNVRKILLDLNEDDIVLITVAVLREPKGIQYMIRAFSSLLDKFSNAHYVIVGDGEYRKPLEELARTLGVADRVRFLGYKENIPELLSTSNLFVFPTLNDALPTVLLEAMATGLPIVASEIGGVPEILVHEKNGLLVPPANVSCLIDACDRLLSDRKLASRLSEAGREVIIQRFNIHQQVDTLKGLYFQLV